jgi:hypothetical protein
MGMQYKLASTTAYQIPDRQRDQWRSEGEIEERECGPATTQAITTVIVGNPVPNDLRWPFILTNSEIWNQGAVKQCLVDVLGIVKCATTCANFVMHINYDLPLEIIASSPNEVHCISSPLRIQVHSKKHCKGRNPEDGRCIANR